MTKKKKKLSTHSNAIKYIETYREPRVDRIQISYEIGFQSVILLRVMAKDRIYMYLKF